MSLLHHDGDVQVTCWCERVFVWVPPAWPRQGRTRSCGWPKCHPPAGWQDRGGMGWDDE